MFLEKNAAKLIALNVDEQETIHSRLSLYATMMTATEAFISCFLFSVAY
jgi:hypothetical protein